jgi:hypothetical protein
MLLKRLIGEKIELEGQARPRSLAGEGRRQPVRAGHRQSRVNARDAMPTAAR